MPSILPTLEKTWEFNTNIPHVGTSNAGFSCGRMLHRAFQALEDEVPGTHIYATGTIDEVSAGVTYGVNPGDTRFDPATIGNVVGKKMQIRGSTTPGNDVEGVTITAQFDTGGGVYRLDYPNASGAAEAAAGHSKVIGDVGLSFPWTTYHTDFRGDNSSIAGDGVDRCVDLHRDLDWAVGAETDAFVKVLRNPVTGTCWAWKGETSSGSGEGTRIHFRMVPGNKFTPLKRVDGRADTDALWTPSFVRPDGTVSNTSGFGDVSGHMSGTLDWFNGRNELGAIFNSIIHVAMSSDGKHTRLVAGTNGGFQWFMFDEEVKNPSGLGSNPQVCGAMSENGEASFGAVYGFLNDATPADVMSIDVDRFATNYELATAYWTTEGFVSSASGQQVLERNAISGNQPLYRIGLQTSTANLLAQARIGELKDIWFTHTAVQPGTTFPDDASRQFLCIGDIVIPWDGSVPELAF